MTTKTNRLLMRRSINALTTDEPAIGIAWRSAVGAEGLLSVIPEENALKLFEAMGPQAGGDR